MPTESVGFVYAWDVGRNRLGGSASVVALASSSEHDGETESCSRPTTNRDTMVPTVRHPAWKQH